MSFIYFGSKSESNASPSIDSKISGLTSEPLDDNQKIRLSTVLTTKISIGQRSFQIQDILIELKTSLHGCKGITLKGSVNEFILDGRECSLNDIDVNFIAEPWSDVLTLEKCLQQFLTKYQDKRRLKFFKDDEFGEYCNASLDVLDISFKKDDVTKPQFRCKIDCRAVDILNKVVIFPNEFQKHHNLQQAISNENIACSIEQFSQLRLTTFAYFTSLFTQGRMADHEFLVAIYNRIFIHYKKTCHLKNDKSFESWLKKVIDEYFLKHIPESQKDARFAFLMDLIIPAYWCYETQQIKEGLEDQKKCLIAIWKIIYPMICICSKGPGINSQLTKVLSSSFESIVDFQQNLWNYLYFYNLNKSTLFFQLEISDHGTKLRVNQPNGHQSISLTSKKWSSCYILIPKVDCIFKLSLTKTLGSPIKDRELDVRCYDMQNPSLELAERLAIIFNLTVFKDSKWQKKIPVEELLVKWNLIFKQLHKEIETPEQSDLYLVCLQRILALSYTVGSDESDFEKLITLYFKELAERVLLAKEKTKFLIKNALPFLSPHQFISGILSQSIYWNEKDQISCIKALSPWFIEATKSRSSKKEIESLDHYVNTYFSNFLFQANLEIREELDMVVSMIKLLFINKISRREFFISCLNDQKYLFVKPEFVTHPSLIEPQVTRQKERETKQLCLIIRNSMNFLDKKSLDRWKDMSLLIDFCLENYSVSKIELKQLWIDVLNCSHKCNQPSIAFKLYSYMLREHWFDEHEKYELQLKFTDNSTEALNQLALIQEQLEIIISCKNPDSSEIIQLIKCWNKVIEVLSKQKLQISIDELIDSFKRSFGPILTLLSNEKTVLKEGYGQIIYIWLLNNLPNIPFTFETHSSSEVRKRSFQFLLLIKKAIKGQKIHDFYLIERYLKILNLIPKVNEQLHATIILTLLSKWQVEGKDIALKTLLEVKKIVSTIKITEENFLQIQFSLAKALFNFKVEAISNIQEIFSDLSNKKFCLTNEGKEFFGEVCMYLLESKNIARLTTFMTFFQYKEFISSQYVEKFLKFVNAYLCSSKSSLLSLNDAIFLHRLLFNHKSLITLEEENLILNCLVRKEVESHTWALNWLECQKQINFHLLIKFFEICSSNELLEKGLNLFVKNNGVMDHKLLLTLPWKRLFSFLKNPLLKELFESVLKNLDKFDCKEKNQLLSTCIDFCTQFSKDLNFFWKPALYILKSESHIDCTFEDKEKLHNIVKTQMKEMDKWVENTPLEAILSILRQLTFSEKITSLKETRLALLVYLISLKTNKELFEHLVSNNEIELLRNKFLDYADELNGYLDIVEKSFGDENCDAMTMYRFVTSKQSDNKLSYVTAIKRKEQESYLAVLDLDNLMVMHKHRPILIPTTFIFLLNRITCPSFYQKREDYLDLIIFKMVQEINPINDSFKNLLANDSFKNLLDSIIKEGSDWVFEKALKTFKSSFFVENLELLNALFTAVVGMEDEYNCKKRIELIKIFLLNKDFSLNKLFSLSFPIENLLDKEISLYIDKMHQYFLIEDKQVTTVQNCCFRIVSLIDNKKIKSLDSKFATIALEILFFFGVEEHCSHPSQNLLKEIVDFYLKHAKSEDIFNLIHKIKEFFTAQKNKKINKGKFFQFYELFNKTCSLISISSSYQNPKVMTSVKNTYLEIFENHKEIFQPDKTFIENCLQHLTDLGRIIPEDPDWLNVLFYLSKWLYVHADASTLANSAIDILQMWMSKHLKVENLSEICVVSTNLFQNIFELKNPFFRNIHSMYKLFDLIEEKIPFEKLLKTSDSYNEIYHSYLHLRVDNLYLTLRNLSLMSEKDTGKLDQGLGFVISLSILPIYKLLTRIVVTGSYRETSNQFTSWFMNILIRFSEFHPTISEKLFSFLQKKDSLDIAMKHFIDSDNYDPSICFAKAYSFASSGNMEEATKWLLPVKTNDENVRHTAKDCMVILVSKACLSKNCNLYIEPFGRMVLHTLDKLLFKPDEIQYILDNFCWIAKYLDIEHLYKTYNLNIPDKVAKRVNEIEKLLNIDL